MENKIKKFSAAILTVAMFVQLICTSTIYAGGNVYYVDAVNGNDENSGLSENQAWRTIQNFSQLTAGDTMLFHAGQTFYNVYLAPVCGSLSFGAYAEGDKPVLCGGISAGGWSVTENGIYAMQQCLENEPYLLKVGDRVYRRSKPESYDKTAAGTFSYDAQSGTLYLNDAQADISAETVIQQKKHIFYIDKQKYIKISGLSMMMTGGAAVNINSRQSQYITVDNNEIAYAESYYSDGSGINCSGGSYSVFSNNTIHDVFGDGILMWNCAGNTVSDNRIWNVRRGNNYGGDGIQCAGKEGNAAPDNRITGNYISMKDTDVGKGCIQQENGNNVYIADNICLYGNFGIEANSNYGIVENNICAYQGVQSGYNWCAGLYMGEEEDITGMIWRGNMVWQSKPFGMRIGGPAENVRTDFRIYNNTILSSGCAFSALVPFSGELYNNIFSNIKAGTSGQVYNVSSVADGGTVVSDYNLFCPERNGFISYLGTSYDSMSVFRMINSDSEINSAVADPLIYGDKTEILGNIGKEWFEPYKNSPSVGNGREITDENGTVLYQSGCNIGAVQTVREDSFNVGDDNEEEEIKPSYRPGLLAYEGFDYLPTAKLAGQNGGIGFSGEWTKTADGVYEGVIGTSSILHDLTYESGYRAKIASGYSRGLDGIFENGTYYISFLLENDSGYGFNMSLGDGSSSIALRNEPKKGKWELKARTKYQLASQSGCDGLVILKLVIGDSRTSVSVWANPDISAGLGTALVSDYTAARFVPDRISFGVSGSNGRFASVDEIRIADNIAAALVQTSPYPERFEVTGVTVDETNGRLTAKISVTNSPQADNRLDLYACAFDDKTLLRVLHMPVFIKAGGCETVEFPMDFEFEKESCTVKFMVWNGMKPMTETIVE